MEYKQDEEDDEDDDERIDYPERNDVPAPLPLVRQNASAPVAEPHIQRNRCDASCLDIKYDWDGKPCRRAGVNAAINKDSTRQHSPRLIVIQAGP